MKHSDLPPRHKAALELLCVVIPRDKHIRTWFAGLVKCPENLRFSALIQMTNTMRHNSEEDDLIDAISALCDPNLFNLVHSAVSGLEE